MTTGQLKAYLRRIIELETSLYTQTEAIESLEHRMNRLAVPNYPSRPSPPKEYQEDFVGCFPMILGFVAAAIIGCILSVFEHVPILGEVLEIFSVMLLWIVPIIFFFLSKKEEKKNVERLNKQEIERYESDMCIYEQNIEIDKMRVRAEQLKKDNLNTVLLDLKQQRNETRRILRYYYSKNILFSKYQNLIAVCSLYEYLMAGRCTTLEGHEGAYNIFETELRLNRICAKLDTVIEHLSDIQDNQMVLYDAIQDGNRASRQLYNESVRQSELLEEAGHNIALAGEYARIAAANAEAGAWIGLANYMK